MRPSHELRISPLERPLAGHRSVAGAGLVVRPDLFHRDLRRPDHGGLRSDRRRVGGDLYGRDARLGRRTALRRQVCRPDPRRPSGGDDPRRLRRRCDRHGGERQPDRVGGVDFRASVLRAGHGQPSVDHRDGPVVSRPPRPRRGDRRAWLFAGRGVAAARCRLGRPVDRLALGLADRRRSVDRRLRAADRLAGPRRAQPARPGGARRASPAATVAIGPGARS